VTENIASYKHGLPSNARLSIAHLHTQLNDGNYLGLALAQHSSSEVLLPQHLQFETVDKSHFSDYSARHSLHAAPNEKCVIVGQAINLDLLSHIICQYFCQAQHLVIQQHYLHSEFAQQAIELTLYHNTVAANNVLLVHKPDASQQHSAAATCDSGKLQANQYSLLKASVLLTLAKDYRVDAFKISSVSLSRPGLLVMDMDSTIIDMECIDEIAILAGAGDKVRELTERAMLGELDFNQSLNARVACLQGIHVAELEKLKNRLPITPGFAHTIAILQKHGWITCIASGGFTYFANYIKDSFELTQATSNILGIEQGCLTGKIEGDIVNGEMKKQILIDTLNHYSIDPHQSIGIGDGANDLLMMSAAALGVAYKAKPKVQAGADANIVYCGFEGLLYCLQP
jgi:phosphoserine phosphatase SerB